MCLNVILKLKNNTCKCNIRNNLNFVDGCRNPEFQQSVKELKEKAEELKGVKQELKEK